jgi:hypothetical protein
MNPKGGWCRDAPLLEALGATTLEARRGAFPLPATGDSEGSVSSKEEELRWSQAGSSSDPEGHEELAPADLKGVAKGLSGHRAQGGRRQRG